MLATVPPRLLERVGVPARERDEGGRARRGGRRRPRRRAPPESQEACFLAGGDYRTFLERQGVAPDAGRDRRRGRRRASAATTASGGSRPASAAASGSRSAEPLFALRSDRATNTLVVGPRVARSATRTVDGARQLHVAVERVEAKLRYRSPAVAAAVTATGDGFVLELDEPVDAVAPGQVAVLYDDDAVVGAGVIDRARRGRIPRDDARVLRR